ncbi:MAG: hypothetical protein WC050_03070 [Candidatus Paceibacterota bacterium]
MNDQDERIAVIHINMAMYKAYIGKRCFCPDGRWALGSVPFLVRELRMHTEGIKELNSEAVLRCGYIVETLAERYLGALDPRTLEEVHYLLENAARVATFRFPKGKWRTPSEAKIMQDASNTISRSVKKLAQPDA